jgi:hypothetical protein
VVYGGEDEDIVRGGDGEDFVHGDEGNDFVDGDDGPDHLFGGAGNDMMVGDDGDDTLEGGDGDDCTTAIWEPIGAWVASEPTSTFPASRQISDRRIVAGRLLFSRLFALDVGRVFPKLTGPHRRCGRSPNRCSCSR